MKKLVFNNMRKICVIIIFVFCIQLVTPVISVTHAEEIPDGVKKVTDKSKKEELLDANGVETSLLGVANNFSIFANQTAEFKSSDVEGRIAARNGVVATTGYEFQAGWKHENDAAAKIIVENGPVENIALNLGANDNGQTFADKKIVAVSDKNESWSCYEQNELENNVVSSNLIDFDAEFSYLSSQSMKISLYDSKSYSMGNYVVTDDRRTANVVDFIQNAMVLQGTNKDLNIFSIPISFFNAYDDMAILFDVPVGSSVIVNLTGSETLYLSEKRGFYFLTDDNEIATLNARNQCYAYALNGGGGLFRDENDNPKIFRRVSPGQLTNALQTNSRLTNEESKPYAERLLWNIPNSTKITGRFAYNELCFMGTILAPHADVDLQYKGYIQGNIICKSIKTIPQIGYVPLKIKGKTSLSIKKNDSVTKEYISGAKLALYEYETDDSGNLVFNNKIKEWTSTDSSETIQLTPGPYVLRELSSPDNCENPKDKNYVVFEVEDELYYNEEDKLSHRGVPHIGYKEEKKTSLVRKSASLVSDQFPETWMQLYNGEPGSLYWQGKLMRELEFKIASVDPSIEDEDLFVVVADNNGQGINSVAWYEFKKWTQVNKGETIKTIIPVIKYFYPHRTGMGYFDTSVPAEDVQRLISFKPHFYTSDGVEVTDKVTISDIKPYYYVSVENDDTNRFTTNLEYTENDDDNSDVYVDKQNGELVLKNKHIKTTVEITKKSDDDKILAGAVYEIQDKDGNVLYTFDKTNEEGKAILEDLLLDAGTYYLVEKEAPKGYEISNTKIEFIVKPHTSEKIEKTTNDVLVVASQDESDGENDPASDKNEKKKTLKTDDGIIWYVLVNIISIECAVICIILKKNAKK